METKLRVAKLRTQNDTGYGRARIDQASRAALEVGLGDTIAISNGNRTSVAKVFNGDPADEGKGLIRIDGLTRTCAGVSIDDYVMVRKINPDPATKICLRANVPDNKTLHIDRGVENLIRAGLMGRPLIEGLDIVIPNLTVLNSGLTFTVSNTSPKGAVVVGTDTQLVFSSEKPEKKDDEKEFLKDRRPNIWMTYDDIGGLDSELKRIRDLVEIPLKHPELFDRIGISPPNGVLMYGPPGTGKTLIAKALANESGASFYDIKGPEILSSLYGESMANLRKVFEEAAANAPSIIFIDEIDSIASKREETVVSANKQLVAQLLTLMDGMGDRKGVIVIGATNRPDDIDSALRRPGRFDREIEIGVPGKEGRRQILNVHTRSMPLGDDVSIEALAKMTQGYVGADLEALCREAAMNCIGRLLPTLQMNDEQLDQSTLSGIKVDMDDFLHALADVEPSGMREVFTDIPDVTWDDIGGMDDIRAEIEEVFLPTENARPYERLGISAGRAILLYGPPGTGKTTIAKAIANSGEYSFLPISGPELMSKWFGDTEEAIRKVFKKAKQLMPCVLFFDEMDSIAPKRGTSDHMESVVAQLLTQMDGIGDLGKILIVGATNRPDAIDPAVLRPGRMDKMILIGKPDRSARESILRVHAKKMPLKDVDLASIADRTDGYVGADLEALCREAGLVAYRRDHDTEWVTMADFEKALKNVPPSVDEDTFEWYSEIITDINKKKRSPKKDDYTYYG